MGLFVSCIGCFPNGFSDLAVLIDNILERSDKDEAVIPSAPLLDAAQLGLKVIADAGVRAPEPIFFADGRIGCTWRSGPNHASVDFDGDMCFPWVVFSEHGDCSGIWDAARETMPEDLLAAIKRIASRKMN